MELYVGCGHDYHGGFINIHGGDLLPKADRVLDLNSGSLLNHFDTKTLSLVLAKDSIGHFFTASSKNSRWFLQIVDEEWNIKI